MATKGSRTYVQNNVGAESNGVQIQAHGRLKQIVVTSSAFSTPGVIEVSTNPSSEISSKQPSSSVIARLGVSSENVSPSLTCDVPLAPFQTVFIHSTGASNTVETNLCVQQS